MATENTTPFPIARARRANDLIFVSGQLAVRDSAFNTDDIETQTNLVIDAIQAILAEFGLDLSAVVRTGVWLVDAADFEGFNRAYARRFQEPFPARATVVANLAVAGARVEIDAIASAVL